MDHPVGSSRPSSPAWDLWMSRSAAASRLSSKRFERPPVLLVHWSESPNPVDSSRPNEQKSRICVTLCGDVKSTSFDSLMESTLYHHSHPHHKSHSAVPKSQKSRTFGPLLWSLTVESQCTRGLALAGFRSSSSEGGCGAWEGHKMSQRLPKWLVSKVVSWKSPREALAWRYTHRCSFANVLAVGFLRIMLRSRDCPLKLANGS